MPDPVAPHQHRRTGRRVLAPVSLPVARLVAVRLGTYLSLVAVLVLVHPLAPRPMLVVATLVALIVVATQWRWRLEPRSTWDLQGVHRAQLLALALTVGGVVIFVVAIDDAVPADLESLQSMLLFVSVSMAFLGAGSFQAIARREGGLWFPLSAAALALLAAVYAVGIRRLGTGWWSWAPLVAVLVAPVFLGICSEWGIQRRTRTRGGAMVRLVPAVVGTALLALLLVVRYRLPISSLWLVAMLFVVVVLVAADNNIDVVFLVVLVAVVWSSLPRSAPLDDAVRPEPGAPVFAAVGDSFISGEGAQRFYEGTNRRAVNECRRAPTAYPVLLATGQIAVEALPDRVAFVACSGASTGHLWARPQWPGEPPEGPAATQIDQLASLVTDDGVELDLALVSVGGNDAGFGVIARTCVLPGPCEELAERWTHQLLDPDGLPAALDRTYAAFGDALPGVRVVVVPYPVPIEPRTCAGSTLTDAEHRFLHDHTVRLNAVAAEAATRAGFEFASPVQWALVEAGRALCGAAVEPGVNWLDLNPVTGSLAQTTNPRNWLHNSLHPNEAGHRTIAASLAAWLAADPAPSVPSPVPDLASRPVALPPVCDDPTPHDVDACERAWMFQHASTSLVGPSIVMLVLVACQWVIAVELIARWRLTLGPERHQLRE